MIQQTNSLFLFRVFNTSQRCCLRISSFFHDVQELFARDQRSKSSIPAVNAFRCWTAKKWPGVKRAVRLTMERYILSTTSFVNPFFSFFFKHFLFANQLLRGRLQQAMSLPRSSLYEKVPVSVNHNFKNFKFFLNFFKLWRISAVFCFSRTPEERPRNLYCRKFLTKFLKFRRFFDRIS